MKKFLIVFVCISLIFCGCQKTTPAEDFEYTFFNNDTKVSIDRYIGTDTEIVVPGKIEGKAVAGVDMHGFNSSVVSVILPDSMEYIGWYAFSGCKSLKKVDLGDSVISIGERAFMQCEALEAIELPSTLETIGNQAFAHCYSLKEVKIPGSIKMIRQEAFYKNTALETVIIENGVERIQAYAFAECDSLQDVTIPASVTFMDYDVFGRCDNLKTVTFEGNAPDANDPFSEENTNLTIYYSKGTTGWDAEVWQKYNMLEK